MMVTPPAVAAAVWAGCFGSGPTRGGPPPTSFGGGSCVI
jgi:hypothetical protein